MAPQQNTNQQEKKQLWLLVGGNGAGKTTFYNQWLAPLGIPFVNADLIARDVFPDAPEQNSYIAARMAEELRKNLLSEGRSFCFETVFSHPSKVDFVATAKTLGYTIIMVFIHLDLSNLNKARVAQRVLENGHHVPDDKVEGRIPRLLENIRKAIPLCDQVKVYNNSSAEDPYQPVATVKNGVQQHHCIPLPAWASYILTAIE